jgi:hypothetical protein
LARPVICKPQRLRYPNRALLGTGSVKRASGLIMKFSSAMLVVVSALAAGAAPVRAQERAQVARPSLEQRTDELSKWLKEYREWEQWFELWGNRVARNANDFQIWGRKTRPEPPAWLAEVCRDEPAVDDQLASACRIVVTWDDQPLQILQRRGSPVATSAGQASDIVARSSFFQRVHLTGLWTRAQYPGLPFYGIVGMQISVVEKGRVTLPATGVMLVMVSDGVGGHEWKPAATLGFGVRLVDFMLPIHTKPLSLHLNIAQSHILGLQDERIISGKSNVGFIGFSVSGKRRR